ncbi:hypothetical protein NDU88_005465 [Pleurodeles waltl]|uniref:Uncharacterized protein n=1 Tax=Pleurodeles waltl TaxID=8319 RepID=A0AAV7MWE9_PLEWA|nr:hypothetical protein NDU88_005465 [Pleurodeles waltl]
MGQGDSRQAVSLPGCHHIACLHLCTRLYNLLSRSGRCFPSPLGRSRGAGEFASIWTGLWSHFSDAGALLSRSPEVAAILVLRSRRGDTLVPPQSLFFACRRLHYIYQVDFRSLGAYLAVRFWGLKMLLFRLGPVHGSGASR